MFGFISGLIGQGVNLVNKKLAEYTPTQIIVGTAAVYFIYNQYQNPWLSRAWRARHSQTYQQRLLDLLYDHAKNIPQIKELIDKECSKSLESTLEKLADVRANMNLKPSIPAHSVSPCAILAEFNIEVENCLYPFDEINDAHKDKQFSLNKGDGQDSGAVYAVHPKELTELLKEVYGATALSNPMHDKWNRINAMQAEIISWCQKLFHGKGYGVLTHGGTTSIIEAMAAYVMHARAKGITYPEIVVPETAHAAFKKAAELTGATLITVPVDKNTGAVDPNTMRSYLSANTAVIVGSAPSFMNGIADPIGEMGALAKEKGIPFHVDACLGGFVSAFQDNSKKPMDFQVEGVTSISADLHKYGLCPKGTSVCLFSKDSPVNSVYAALNWSGGLYATPGVLDGSTSGARVAEVYATLSYYGEIGFIEIANKIIALRAKVEKKVANIEGVEIFGEPELMVLGFKSNSLNIHWIADEMDKKGWKLNLLQNPDGFHLCLTHVHTLVDDFTKKFISDLLDALTIVKELPSTHKPSGNVKVYGTVGMMPTGLQQRVCEEYQVARLQLPTSPTFFENHQETTGEHQTQKKNPPNASVATMQI